MLGKEGTEQFVITTRVDGKIIGEQRIHDPFLHCKTVIATSRWDLFKALFRKQHIVTVEVSVRGTEGVQRVIMSLDPASLERETMAILDARRQSRTDNASANHCYAANDQQ